jgi:hypothetical protein
LEFIGTTHSFLHVYNMVFEDQMHTNNASTGRIIHVADQVLKTCLQDPMTNNLGRRRKSVALEQPASSGLLIATGLHRRNGQRHCGIPFQARRDAPQSPICAGIWPPHMNPS